MVTDDFWSLWFYKEIKQKENELWTVTQWVGSERYKVKSSVSHAVQMDLKVLIFNTYF